VRSAPRTAPPVITEQPRNFQTLAAGAAVTLSAAASGDAPLAYQWQRNGTVIAGATASSLSLSALKAADAGTYTLTVTNAGGTATTSNAVVALGTARLANLSVRSVAGADSETLIVGFYVGQGTAPSLLVRGIGPTLGAFGVTGALADPVLTFYRAGGVSVGSNDDWGNGADAARISTAAAQSGAFALGAASKDAALLVQPASGSYTVQLTGKAATGVALIEAYDVAPVSGAAPLINLSARTRAGTGAEVLIAGFVVSGSEPKRLLIRGVGPGLTPLGVTGVLADPQLAVYRQGASVALLQNDDWNAAGGGAAIAAAATQVGSFALGANSKDAALLGVFEPGAYTAQVSGVGGTTGVALLEVYDVP
jgi:hypothetical protein